jgi:hypothetical protein
MGKHHSGLRRRLTLPGTSGLLPKLLQVLLNVDQLLFKVAVEPYAVSVFPTEILGQVYEHQKEIKMDA